MKKICVIGSGGFIASHLIETLHARDCDVIGLQRHITSEEPIHYPDTIYLGDVKDREVVDRAVGISDGVINLSGLLGTQETVNNPYPSVDVNVIGALNVLEAARSHRVPMVQIAVGNHWMENSYSITKTTAERFTRMYAIEHKVSANVVRALNAFGERQKAYPVRKMMPSFITRALKNEPIQIYGDGTQTMDFIYVKDVANILANVLFGKEAGQTFEAGTGKGMTVLELAQKVIKATESTSTIEHLPMRPGEPPQSSVVAKNPYPFEYTNFDEALERTVKWYRENQ